MKKSTIKFILLTLLGIAIAIFAYYVDNNVDSYLKENPRWDIGPVVYIAPFIGLIYWIFGKQLDE